MKKSNIVLGAGLIAIGVILADAAWENLIEVWVKTQLYPDATLKARESGWRDFLAILALMLVAVSVAVFLTVLVQHRRARQALRESRSRFGAVIDNSPNLIYIRDRDGRYLLTNKEFDRRHGIEPGSAVGKTPHDLVPGEVADGYLAADRKVLESGEARSRETDLTYGDGATRTVLTAKFPILGADGQAVAVGVVSTDISARKRAEDALRRAHGDLEKRVAERTAELRAEVAERQRAEEELRRTTGQAEDANRAKSEFLANMSHDLRTPMNAILGFGQLLGHDAMTPLTPRQREYVGFILQGGQNLLELVDDVLDLARIEAGKIVLAPTDVVLGEVIEENLPLVRPAAEKRGIELVNHCAARRPSRLRVDYTRFKQVLLNLLSNAVKYNRDGGTVTLDCRKLPDGLLRVSVADTGHGIPSVWRDLVFRPFSRLGAESTNTEGTGLGLSICKQLVEAMGGKIGFESRIGQGTTFWVDIPEARKRPPGERPALVACTI